MNQINQINKTNQINQTNHTEEDDLFPSYSTTMTPFMS